MSPTDQAAIAACAVVLIGLAAGFATIAALRHNDGPNRAWATGTLLLAPAAALVGWGGSGEVPRLVGAWLTVAVPFAFATLGWGVALMDGKPPRWGVGGSLAALAAGGVVLLVEGDRPGGWAWAVSFATAAAVALATAWALMTGSMRGNLNSRVLEAVCVLAAAGLVVAATMAARDDASHLVVAVVTTTAFLAVAMPCLTALRVERSANWWAMRDETQRRDLTGVLGRDAFDHDAQDRLERAHRLGVPLFLTLARVDALQDLNRAFGREAGDAALAHVAGTLRRHTPPTALLGNLGAGIFGVLSAESPAVVTAAVTTGLLHDPLPSGLPTRVEVSYGWAEAAVDQLADVERAARGQLSSSTVTTVTHETSGTPDSDGPA